MGALNRESSSGGSLYSSGGGGGFRLGSVCQHPEARHAKVTHPQAPTHLQRILVSNVAIAKRRTMIRAGLGTIAAWRRESRRNRLKRNTAAFLMLEMRGSKSGTSTSVTGVARAANYLPLLASL
jgi:hypothetical protein